MGAMSASSTGAAAESTTAATASAPLPSAEGNPAASRNMPSYYTAHTRALQSASSCDKAEH
eukprot:13693-Heterococcus_DN1.PRE.8